MGLKSIIVYYLLILAPLAVLYFCLKSGAISNNFFAISILIYVLLYHPLVSGIRLLALKLIDKSQFRLNFIPFWNAKYFTSLYFRNAR